MVQLVTYLIELPESAEAQAKLISAVREAVVGAGGVVLIKTFHPSAEHILIDNPGDATLLLE